MATNSGFVSKSDVPLSVRFPLRLAVLLAVLIAGAASDRRLEEEVMRRSPLVKITHVTPKGRSGSIVLYDYTDEFEAERLAKANPSTAEPATPTEEVQIEDELVTEAPASLPSQSSYFGTLPACVFPPDVRSNWTTNGLSIFKLYFRNLPKREVYKGLSVKNATLFLRIKPAKRLGARGQASLQALAPSLESVAKDLRIVLDEPTCTLAKAGTKTPCLSEYHLRLPAARRHHVPLDVTKIIRRWLTEIVPVPRTISLQIKDAVSGKIGEIGKYFVGLRCDARGYDQRAQFDDLAMTAAMYTLHELMGDSFLSVEFQPD